MTAPLTQGVRIHPPAIGLGTICEPILRSLPEWFGIEASVVDYVKAIERMPTVLASQNDQPIGFMTLECHFPTSAELHVLGIQRQWHRHGIGAAMLAATEEYARSQRVRFLQVKTLSPRREDDNYAGTRRWYEAMGFEPLTEFLTLWDEANPCLQMIKVL
ncbi:MAG: GNAT family N-acetyltransferase [Phycisphaerales bacterium]|jgi:GNAT superfamily N-acetyltransferase|nr:GNAT family N-acetyltransferase [Phycisphaerales bacterium]MDP6890832.1 GNAT family N-acetyltransferase [Phycisphaerales bacterium]